MANNVENGEASTSAPSALSFGFSAPHGGRAGAANQRRAVGVNITEEGPHRELITGVEGSRIQPAVSALQPEQRRYVVPRIENTYRIGGQKFTPSFKPPANDAPTVRDGVDRFEAAVASALPTLDPSAYGLQPGARRAQPAAAPATESSARDTNAGNGIATVTSATAVSVGINEGTVTAVSTAVSVVVANSNGVSGSATANSNYTVRLTEEQALRRDVEALPEGATLEAYEDLPIEHFGRAMLAGMGWVEGEGVGRKRKEVSAIEYVRRPDRLGLGAAPVPVAPAKKSVVKMGDQPPRQDLVLAPDADGRQRHVRQLDEKLVLRSAVQPGPQPGKVMRLAGGRHAGLQCTVLTVLPRQEGRSERATVRLEASNVTVDVRCKELAELWMKGAAGATSTSSAGNSGAEPRADGRGAEREHWSRKADSHKHSGRDVAEDDDGASGSGGRRDNDGLGTGRAHDKSKRQRSSMPCNQGPKQSRQEDAAPEEALWLSHYIKVRIIDKAALGGKLYLKKGTVIDVHPGQLADLSVDDTADIVQLPQSFLETVVPKGEGAPLLIVRGNLRGQRARLLQARVADGCAAVQLVEDQSLQRLMLDDIAQYMGSMEDE